MFRIKHLIPTVAVVIAAGALAPVAQAHAEGLYPHVTSKTTVVGFFDPAGRAAYARDEDRVTIEFTDAARSRWRRRNNVAPECVITTPTH